MAFMGRGGMPSIGGGGESHGIHGDSNYVHNNHHRGMHYHHRMFYYYYVPLDSTYVAIQLVIIFIILIMGVCAYLTTYKSTIVDPIESTKKLFLNMYMITIGILAVLTLIINSFSKTESAIVKRLLGLFFISSLIMITFFGIKSNMDSKYTKSQFDKLYSEQGINENSDKKSKVAIGISGMRLKTDREYYIDECVKLYNIFKTKVNITLGAHLLLNILLIYQIIKILKMQNKKNQINKDDLILFDEEQNIKI